MLTLGAIVAIALLILLWNWITHMRDVCIKRTELKQVFICLPPGEQIVLIELFRGLPDDYDSSDFTGPIRSVLEFAELSGKRKDSILAMLIDWHSTELAGTQSVADA